jgi:hypothetical protein
MKDKNQLREAKKRRWEHEIMPALYNVSPLAAAIQKEFYDTPHDGIMYYESEHNGDIIADDTWDIVKVFLTETRAQLNAVEDEVMEALKEPRIEFEDIPETKIEGLRAHRPEKE